MFMCSHGPVILSLYSFSRKNKGFRFVQSSVSLALFRCFRQKACFLDPFKALWSVMEMLVRTCDIRVALCQRLKTMKTMQGFSWNLPVSTLPDHWYRILQLSKYYDELKHEEYYYYKLMFFRWILTRVSTFWHSIHASAENHVAQTHKNWIIKEKRNYEKLTSSIYCLNVFFRCLDGFIDLSVKSTYGVGYCEREKHWSR